MSDTVIASLISGVVGIICAVIANRATLSKFMNELNIKQALTDQKLEAIDKKLEEHNGYGKKFVEANASTTTELKNINRRLDNLERGN